MGITIIREGKRDDFIPKEFSEQKRTTEISWTQHTWNPFVGCSVHTAGCANCYAMKQAGSIQLKSEGAGTKTHYTGTTKWVKGESIWNGTLKQSPQHIIDKPRKIKGHALVFVNSMSDFFHENALYDWQNEAMKVMEETPQHTYQILTKRPENIIKFLSHYGGHFPDNVWVGATMERADYRFRIDLLRQVPCKVHFLSIEPLIGSAGKLDLRNIQWVIVGGESGPGARRMERDWVIEIRDQCKEQDVPFFFKQWGKPEFNPLYAFGGSKFVTEQDPNGKGGSRLDGIEYKEFPNAS